MRDTFIQARLNGITPPDREAMEGARLHWDAIAKPLHGLGRLEDMVVRIAGAAGTPEVRLDRKGVAVFCADNGVVAEGVTQTGQEVTLAVARSMAAGRSSVCRMPGWPGRRAFRWTWGCWPTRQSPVCGTGWSWRGGPGT